MPERFPKGLRKRLENVVYRAAPSERNCNRHRCAWTDAEIRLRRLVQRGQLALRHGDLHCEVALTGMFVRKAVGRNLGDEALEDRSLSSAGRQQAHVRGPAGVDALDIRGGQPGVDDQRPVRGYDFHELLAGRDDRARREHREAAHLSVGLGAQRAAIELGLNCRKLRRDLVQLVLGVSQARGRGEAPLRLHVVGLQLGLGHLLAIVADIASLLRSGAGQISLVALEHAHGVLGGEAFRRQPADALELLIEQGLLLDERVELTLAAFNLLANARRLPGEGCLLSVQSFQASCKLGLLTVIASRAVARSAPFNVLNQSGQMIVGLLSTSACNRDR